MKLLLTLLAGITWIVLPAQTQSPCRIDIYLVKHRIPCWDSTTKKIIPFQVTKADLQDTPFIKNEEITSYRFKKFRYKIQGKLKKGTARLHGFTTAASINERLDSLRLSMFGCARQFAVVCDGEIIYGGCVNNAMSSWVPPMVVLTGRGNSVTLSFYRSMVGIDPREDKRIVACLKNSHRWKQINNNDDE